MNAWVLGVDPGTIKLGLAVMRNGKFVSVHLIKVDKRDPRRLRLPKIVVEKFKPFLDELLKKVDQDNGVLFVAFEQPVIKYIPGSSKVKSSALATLALAEVVGAMKTIVWQAGVEPDFVFDVPTTHARRKLVGRGVVPKSEVMEAAKAILEMDGVEEIPTEDMADAVAVAFSLWLDVKTAVSSGDLQLRMEVSDG